MPRYLVERSFPHGLGLPQNAKGAQVCINVVGENAQEGVTWAHSYFTPDRTKSFCIYDGSNPDSIRKAAQRTKIAVGKITAVRVLDGFHMWNGR
jgi:hypothetical protein